MQAFLYLSNMGKAPMIPPDYVEHFFIATLDDLRKKRNGSNYEIIRSAGLLRQLLADGSKSLLHQANKNYKLKITFPVRDNTEVLKARNFKMWWGCIYSVYGEDTIYITLDRFLEWPICIRGDDVFNVKDFIDYFCYIFGGVHSGKPSGEKEKNFTTIPEIPLPNQIPLESIRGIIEVTLRGLEELEDTIKKSLEANRNIKPPVETRGM